MSFDMLCDDVREIILSKLNRKSYDKNDDNDFSDTEYDFEDWIKEDSSDNILHIVLYDFYNEMKFKKVKNDENYDFEDIFDNKYKIIKKKQFYKQIYKQTLKLYYEFYSEEYLIDYKTLIFENKLITNEIEVLNKFKPKGFENNFKSFIYNTIDNIIYTEDKFYCKNCKKLYHRDYEYVKIDDDDVICDRHLDSCFNELFSRYNLFYTDEDGDYISTYLYSKNDKLIKYDNILIKTYINNDWKEEVYTINLMLDKEKDMKMYFKRNFFDNLSSKYDFILKIFEINMKIINENPTKFSKSKILEEIELYNEVKKKIYNDEMKNDDTDDTDDCGADDYETDDE